jgi:hypothetical protein
MTQLLPSVPPGRCPADRCCSRLPCFQARIEATAGHRTIRTSTEVCAEHLGDTVQALTTWARQQGLRGHLTVLATGQPGSRHAASPGTPPGAALPSGFAFSTIALDPSPARS